MEKEREREKDLKSHKKKCDFFRAKHNDDKFRN